MLLHHGIHHMIILTQDSTSIRILYLYVTFSGDINRSYAVVIQQKSRVRREISAPSVPSCVHVNNLSFKKCIFQVVKSPYSCRDRCYCYCCFVGMLGPSEIGEIQVPVAHEHRLLSRPDLHQIKDLILCFLKNLT